MIDLMPAAGHYLLIYDVSDDKERRLVEKAVKGFGFRVQKSAFECQLTKGWKTMLQKRLLGLNLRTGYAYLYRMAPNAQRWAVGVLPEQQPEVEEENFVYVA